MRQRDTQRLVILGVGLFIVFNLPFVMILQEGNFRFLGYPSFYLFVFLIWLFSIIFSWFTINKKDE